MIILTIYILVLAICLLFGMIFNPNKNNMRKKIYLLSVFGLIILFSSLRSYMIGIDLKDHYYKAFVYYSDKSFDFFLSHSPYDKGYIFFYHFIYYFTKNPQVMIAIHSVIVFSIVGRFIYKNSNNVIMSSFVFIAYNSWFMYMTMLRQSLAIAVLLIATEIWSKRDLKKKRIVYFYLLVFIASTFHSSAIIFSIYPLVEKIPVKKTTIFLSIIGIIFTTVFYNQIFILISKIISVTKDYTSFYANDISIVNVTTIYSIAVGAITLFLSYIYIYRNNSIDKNAAKKETISNDFLVFLVIIFTTTRILRIKIGIIARASEYFLPFLWILLPRTLNNITRKNDRVLIKFITYSLFVLAFVWCGYSNGADLYGTVPYKFFWE